MFAKTCRGAVLLAVLAAAGLAAVSGPTPEQLAAWANLPAGTEILELRTECSRHYSNGDGSFRAEIYSAPAFRRNAFGQWEEIPAEPVQPAPAEELRRLSELLESGTLTEDEAAACERELAELLQAGRVPDPKTDAEENVYPQTSTYWTGYVENSYGSYYKYDDWLWIHRYNRMSYIDHGWVKFNLASLPGAILVTDAKIYTYGYNWTSSTYTLDIRSCGVDPVTATASQIYTAIEGGTAYSSAYSPQLYGYYWSNVSLNAAGRTAIEGAVSSGYIAMGFRKTPGTYGYYQCYGWSGGSYRPYMTLTYYPACRYDVSVTAITQPPPVCSLGPYVPQAKVKNVGTENQPAPFYVKYWVTGAGSYRDSVLCTALTAGKETTLNFATWNIAARGTYLASCSTMSAYDSIPTDDKKTQTIKAGAMKVLFLSAEYPQYAQALAESLNNRWGDEIICDTMDVGYYGMRIAPSIAYLRDNRYNAILTWSNYGYTNSAGLGETLARYLESGIGGVVWGVFAHSYSMGRFTQYYTPFTTGNSTYGTKTLGTIHQPTHKIMEKVSGVTMGGYTSTQSNLSHTTAYKVASWNDGYINTACNDTINRRVVALGWFPTAMIYTTVGDSWLRQLKNCLQWVGRNDDVGVTRLIAPVGQLDSGMTVTPACSVYNFGNQVETYKVKLVISPSNPPYVDSATVTGHTPGSRLYVPFRDWTATVRGSYTARCSTELAVDADTSNNRKVTTGSVRVMDAGVVSVTAPSGTYPIGSSVTPAGTWKNYGNVNASFGAWAVLLNPSGIPEYANFIPVSNLTPGAQLFISAFPSHVCNVGGLWTVRCSTNYAGDMVSSNDAMGQTFLVGSPDIGVMGITSPLGRVDTNADVTPAARFKNYGDCATGFTTWFIMRDPDVGEVYRRQVVVASLAVDAETVVTFPTYNVGTTVGVWNTRCSLTVAGDVNPANNVANNRFTVGGSGGGGGGGWQAMRPMPAGAKPVKDGGWVAIGEAGGLIYAARGNKQPDFFSYSVEDSTWTALAPIPNGTEAKPPSKGAVGCVAGGKVYAVKGNNTLGFWCYDPATTAWSQLSDVPLGGSGKKVKGGTDLVGVTEGDTTWLYLLKGGKDEFFRYNTASGTWDEGMPPAPTGVNAKWDKGSWLVYNGTTSIYAHKAKYHELWRFNVPSHTWGSSALPGMPLAGMMGKSKKSKDGGCGAYYDGGIYALKGGNTQEFWRFDVGLNSWAEKETIPAVGTSGKKKRVKAGSDIVSYGGGVFFALKGNKSDEFWRYTEGTVLLPPRPARSGVAGGTVGLTASGFSLTPNPTQTGSVTLTYSLPAAGAASVRVFDVTGRTVLERAFAAGRTGATTLNLGGLGAGVYLVKLEGQGHVSAHKLVVE